MLSTKFKVSFVKLSLEIRRGLKDILHTVVTSKLIIISHEKSLMCWKIKQGSGWEGVWVSVCFWVNWGTEGGGSFLEMHFCIFFFYSCSLRISTDIKRHQIARNSPWLCMAEEGCRYFNKSKSACWNTWQNALWGWLRLRRKSQFFYSHHSLLLTPFLLQTTLRRRGWAVSSVTPASKSYTDLHFYANSGCHGFFAKKPREAKIDFSPEVWLKCSPLPEL